MGNADVTDTNIVWIAADNSFKKSDHRAARGTGRH
jgi:hypothetical protein